MGLEWGSRGLGFLPDPRPSAGPLRRQQPDVHLNRHLQFAISVVLAIGGFALLLCLAAFNAGQVGTAMPSEAHPFGSFGAWTANLILRGYGLAGFLVPALAIGWAVAL